MAARREATGSLSRRYILTAYYTGYTGARKSHVLALRAHQVKDEYIDFNKPHEKQSNKSKPIVPMNRKLRTFMRIWKRTATETGYIFTRNGRPVGDVKNAMPNLRHAAAVQMLINGVSPYKVAKYLGNSIEMVYKHYGHLIPNYLDSAAEAL
ncbi:MAG: hypothetical protein H6861_01110 [Rhodospirillales bacterium]|nr:hypothetical protein [Rhodospirillales bacterium]